MKRRLNICLLAMLLMLGMTSMAVTGAKAQSTTDGAIGGVVTDPSGAVVTNATITVTNPGTASTSTGWTDDNGRYIVGHLPPGVYSLTVSANGFGGFRATSVTVEVGRLTGLDVRLSVQTQAETVIATADAPVITTDRADFSTNINLTTIENLPINGRRWSFFALGTPGATPDGGFGLVSFRGISGLLNNNTVDGADNNQAFFSEERGRTRISYSTSEASIQEFQVNTSNYSSEYGRAAGGVVNAVTKSGTNQIHGDAFWYFRNSDWGAINSFTTHKVNNIPVPFLPEDKRHQFGGGIGGPIWKDKLFFFFSADQQLRPFPATANSGTLGAIFAPLSASEQTTLQGRGVDPASPLVAQALQLQQDLTGNVGRRGDQLILLPKIDWDVTSKHHASFTYNRLRWHSPQGIQTGAIVNRGIDSFGNDDVKEDWGIARVVSSFGTNITNELRYQYGRDFEFENGAGLLSGEPASGLGFSPQITIGGVGGWVFGMPNFLNRSAFPDERRNQIADTVSWSHGKHLFKFGFDFNHVHDLEVNLFTGFGAYNYNTRVDWITDFAAFETNPANPARLCGPATAHVPCYTLMTQGLGTPGFQFSTNDLAFFAQDDWRITPRLTLNLGLRWDTEILPSPQIPNPTLPLTNKFPSDRTNFGPRLGFAYDLLGGGTTVIRGGYGIFYGRIINSTIFSAISSTGLPQSQSTTNIAPSTTSVVYPNVLLNGTQPPVNVEEFAPNTKLPMVHEFDLSFEHEFAKNTAVSVSYVGSLGRRLPRFFDTNLFAPTQTTTYTVTGGGLFNGQTFTVPFFGVPELVPKNPPPANVAFCNANPGVCQTGTFRPNNAVQAISLISDSVNSNYNALVVALNRRFYQSFQIQSSITWSHASDFGQSSQTFTPNSGINVLNPLNLRDEYSRSNFDIRVRFNFAAIWSPNYYHGDQRWVGYLANGFTFSPLVVVSTGVPFTPTLTGSAPSQTFASGEIFTAPGGASGSLGVGGTTRVPFLGANSFQMPKTWNVDFRLAKEFKVWESWKLQLSGDAFNIFNHPDVTAVSTQMFSISTPAGAPVGTSNLVFQSNFGKPTATSNTLLAQRQIQVGIRLAF